MLFHRRSGVMFSVTIYSQSLCVQVYPYYHHLPLQLNAADIMFHFRVFLFREVSSVSFLPKVVLHK